MKKELISLFCKTYKERTSFSYIPIFSRDIKMLNEINKSICVDDKLLNKFFDWYLADSWHKNNNVLPEVKILYGNINRVVAYKPVERTDYR